MGVAFPVMISVDWFSDSWPLPEQMVEEEALHSLGGVIAKTDMVVDNWPVRSTESGNTE